MPENTYQQLSKNAVRERMLPAAIRRLTCERLNSCVVREEELRSTVEQFLDLLKDLTRDQYRNTTTACLAEWTAYNLSEIGTKRAETLKILYLCGPEPLNDLQVMMAAGVNPNNVWAITNDADDHSSAVAECAESGIPLKIYNGSLNEFFDTFNQSFDIIYFDACGPFCGGTPNTLDPLVTVFERQRLNSPGALITNFCAPPDRDDARKRYIDLVTSYYAPRQFDAPKIILESGLDPQVYKHEPQWLEQLVEKHLDQVYPDFISSFLTDLGMNLIPNARALRMAAVLRSYLAQEELYQETVKLTLNSPSEISGHRMPAEIDLVPEGYALLTFLRSFKAKRPNDPLLQRLANSRNGGKKTGEELLQAASVLNAVIEGHWNVLGKQMRKVVDQGWFDEQLRITCDLPLPNLLINSLLGLYGRPWFVNPRLSERISYTAKTRQMHCDLLILDQCRTYYDWFPTLEACEGRFQSIPFQIVARSIMDRIERHGFSRITHPFRGAAVVGLGEGPFARWYELSEREVVNCL